MQSPLKTILITGCSSGIGLCTARGLKERGYRVFATARKAEDVATLAAEGFEALPLDLAVSDSIHAAVDEILKRTGNQLHALFNNGAYGQPGAVEDLSREAIREQFETNVFGWLELTNRVLPIMRQQGYGRIIQNSSILGFIALRYRGAYNASKYAIEGFADTMRLELTGTDIYISLIEPGPIRSRFRENALKAFQKHIKPEQSVHFEYYKQEDIRLKKKGDATPFTLGPEAVLEKLIHALESKKPKIRYPVTFPAHLFSWLKRLLSARMLDKVLLKT